MPDQVTVESFDQGRSWTARDEPALNLAGLLVIGQRPCGRAPAAMRVGSGAYSFTIQVVQWLGSLGPETEAIKEEGRRESDAIARSRALGTDPDYDKRRQAAAKARRLLISHLSSRQRMELESSSNFTVTARSGARYRIESNFSRNVLRLDARGVPIQRFCAHAVVNVPVEDNMLAQKLLLETSEDEFLAKANAGTPELETYWGPAGPEIAGLGVEVEGVRISLAGVRPPRVFGWQLVPGGERAACALVNGVVAPLVTV